MAFRIQDIFHFMWHSFTYANILLYVPLTTKDGAKSYLLIMELAPETTYHRDIVKPLTEKDSSAENNESEKASTEAREESSPTVPRKRTYLEELSVYNGIYSTKASIWRLLARPFVACLTPVCLWASLLYGVAISWLVLISTAVAQLFSAARKLSTFISRLCLLV